MNLKNPKTAIVILALVVLFSSCFSGVIGLNQKYKSLSKEFLASDMAKDRDDAVDFAALVVKVAQVNTSVDVSEMSQLIDEYTNSEDLSETQKTFEQIQKSFLSLKENVEKAELSTEARNSFEGYCAEFEESAVYVSRSDFNENLEDFNEILAEFPASLFAGILNIEQISCSNE